jgi:hypothetical protein
MNDERCVCGHVEIDHENGKFECRACSDETVPCPMFVLDRVRGPGFLVHYEGESAAVAITR